MSDRPKLILSDKVFEALAAAGIVQEHDKITRIVIDLQVREAPVLYLRRYGDERLLSVVETLDGIEIRDGGGS